MESPQGRRLGDGWALSGALPQGVERPAVFLEASEACTSEPRTGAGVE